LTGHIGAKHKEMLIALERDSAHAESFASIVWHYNAVHLLSNVGYIALREKLEGDNRVIFPERDREPEKFKTPDQSPTKQSTKPWTRRR
jgi:hypothetical protein